MLDTSGSLKHLMTCGVKVFSFKFYDDYVMCKNVAHSLRRRGVESQLLFSASYQIQTWICPFKKYTAPMLGLFLKLDMSLFINIPAGYQTPSSTMRVFLWLGYTTFTQSWTNLSAPLHPTPSARASRRQTAALSPCSDKLWNLHLSSILFDCLSCNCDTLMTKKP